MKNNNWLKKTAALTVGIACVLSTIAQELATPTKLEVKEGVFSQEGKPLNGFRLTMEGKDKDINDDWADFLRDNYDFKIKAKARYSRGENLLQNLWSQQRFDLFSAVSTEGNSTLLTVWMTLPNAEIVSSAKNGPEAQQLQLALKKFFKDYYIHAFSEELKDKTKEVTSQNKELVKLTSKQEKAESAVRKEQEAIRKANEKKAKLDAKIEKLREKIIDENKTISESKQELAKQNEIISSTQSQLSTESGKFELIQKEQEKVKNKIKTVEAL